VTRCGGAAQAAGFAALCRVVGGGWLESDFGWFGTLPSTTTPRIGSQACFVLWTISTDSIGVEHVRTCGHAKFQQGIKDHHYF
jgi:hypothetical protein